MGEKPQDYSGWTTLLGDHMRLVTLTLVAVSAALTTPPATAVPAAAERLALRTELLELLVHQEGYNHATTTLAD